jgi:hypothetical protein
MKLLIILFISGSIFSCGVKNENDIKPKKIIQQMQFLDQDTAVYYYDGKNITKIMHPERYHTLEYRDSLVVIENVADIGKDSPFLVVEYVYNDDNKIQEVRYNSLSWTDNSLFLAAAYSYEYENGMVLKEYYHDNEINHDTLYYNRFEHDSEGNIIKKITFTRDTLTKGFFEDFEIVYEYDNKNHYLKNVNYQQFGMYYSKTNNVLKETYNFIHERWQKRPSNENNFKYVYNENNFPTLCIKNETDTLMQIAYE